MAVFVQNTPWLWQWRMLRLRWRGGPIFVNRNSGKNKEMNHNIDANHPFVSWLNSSFTWPYIGLVLVAAYAVCWCATRKIWRAWNRPALLKALLLYLIAGGLVFHVVWILLVHFSLL